MSLRADDLIFHFGWRVGEVEALPIGRVLFWHVRAVDYLKRRRTK